MYDFLPVLGLVFILSDRLGACVGNTCASYRFFGFLPSKRSNILSIYPFDVGCQKRRKKNIALLVLTKKKRSLIDSSKKQTKLVGKFELLFI